MKSYLALLLLAASLSGCTHGSEQAPPATAEQSAPGATDSAAAPTAAANLPKGSSPADLATAAKTQQEGADTSTGPDTSEAALERIAALPTAGQLPSGQWVAGTHYSVLSPAQPTDVSDGKVEVIEYFWYACPHCYALDATVEAWRKDKAGYVEFRRVPVTWQDEHRSHARLFYTLKALGKLDELHTKVFEEIHQKGDLLYVAGDEKATLQADLQFAKSNGISESDFNTAYNSFGVQNSVQQADDLMRREKIDSVPTFVINGKYVSDVSMAGSPAKLFQLINELAASEKHH
jgi:protein dithiol oxidoreductase (disulfide-forming)